MLPAYASQMIPLSCESKHPIYSLYSDFSFVHNKHTLQNGTILIIPPRQPLKCTILRVSEVETKALLVQGLSTNGVKDAQGIGGASFSMAVRPENTSLSRRYHEKAI